jgi:hypothetical protein
MVLLRYIGGVLGGLVSFLSKDLVWVDLLRKALEKKKTEISIRSKP